MNNTKKVGRPCKFDPEEALMTAVQVFWAKGYDGASMKDLTEAMGINSPSLYASFGDKHQLYLKAIHRYITKDACAPLLAFEAETDITCAVRAFLEESIGDATQQDGNLTGCFLSSCVATSAGEVDGVQELLRQSIEATDARIAQRFEAAKADGQLDRDFPSLERARLMLDLRQGHALRGRAGLDPATMCASLDHHVRIVLA